MRSKSLSILALFAVTLAIPVHAQIDPYRPIAHNTLGIYQDAGASWGWERVGSWGWERVGSWGWERVGSWGWERIENPPPGPVLVGLVYVESSAVGGAMQHWAFFDNYDAEAPTQVMSSRYDYPDLTTYLGDVVTLASSYVPVPAGNGQCQAEPTCVTLRRGTTQVADALIKQGNPTKNYGGSQSLSVVGGASGDTRALLRFDTSTIPGGAMIESANLSLSGLLYGGSAAVTAVMAPWSEASITWAAFEAMGGPFGVTQGGPHLWRVAATVPYTSAGATTTTALGTLVQAWVDGVIPNHGMVLDKTTTEALVVFASSEVENPLLRPTLNVCYRACATGCNASCGEDSLCIAGRCRDAEKPFDAVCGAP